ncbi:MAG: chemotaxis protein CheD [Methanospirillaceae archaeon]|nr:chemotaxis protein CheD [Methanospirillaceae archaeon]
MTVSLGKTNFDVILIGIGEHYVGDTVLSSIGLGSCVGLVLHDKTTGIGGLAHIMLPDSQGKTPERPGKFADTAVSVLLQELEKKGANRTTLIAKLAGGASMFQNFSGNLNIGDRNVEMLRLLLAQEKIRIVSEDVGGTVGRTVTYYPQQNARYTIKFATGNYIEI